MSKGIKTPSGEIVHLKKNFESECRLEPFYTGGGVAVSGDGRTLYTSCGSAVKAVDMATGQTARSITEEEDSVASVAVSCDGELLAVGWRSILVKLYSLKEELKCSRSWKAHIGPTVTMAFDSSSTLLATGSTDSSIKVWDCVRHYCTHNLRGSSGLVSLVKFHPTKLQLLSTSADNNIRIWDLQTSRCVHVLRGHVSAVTTLDFSSTGDLLISGGRDQVVLLWELDGGTLKHTLPVYESVEGVAVIPLDDLTSPPVKKRARKADNVVFATAGDKGVIRIWNTANSDPIHTLEPLPQGVSESSETSAPQSYSSLMYSDHCLLGVTFDHSILMYDSREEFSKTKEFLGYLDEVLDLAPIGTSHLAVATNSEQVKVYNRQTGSCQLLTGHAQIILCLDVSGDLLVTGSRDNSIRVWRMAEGAFQCVAIGTGHTHHVGAVVLSRTKVSFAVSASEDCTLKLWGLKTLREVGMARVEPTHLTVKYTQLAHDKDINGVDVSPNDRLLATGSLDRTAKLWQTKDGALLGTMRGHRRGVWSVRFSPVDQCVATASGDSTVRLWSVTDCSCVKTFEGHTSSVLKVVFLSRGMQLASSGGDGLVKVWTIRTNECAATLDGHTDRVWALAATPEGGVVSGGGDSVLCYWKDVTASVEKAQIEEQEDVLLRQQELDNLLQQRDYVRAVGVAISLDQPYRLLSLLQDMQKDECGQGSKFNSTLLSLPLDQQAMVLRYSTRWNQNAKHCHIAQSVLSVLLSNLSTEALLSMDGLSDHVRSLIPYTERHLQRLDRLEELSMFVEYSCQKMSLRALEEVPVGVYKTTVGTNEMTVCDADYVLTSADSTTPTDCTVSCTEPTYECCHDDDLVTSTSVNPPKAKMSRRKAHLKRLIKARNRQSINS